MFCSGVAVEAPGRDGSLKKNGAGKAELVVRRIVHGRSLREMAVLSEGATGEMEGLAGLTTLR